MKAEQPREITYAGDTLRIVLRSTGAGRFIGAIFLLVWLVPWAIGEAFAINFLLAFLGSELRLPAPLQIPPFGVGLPSILPIAFLLVWTTFWTWGGLSAITQTLRLLAGTDTLEVMPSQWVLVESYVFFSRRRIFRREEGWSAELRRRDRALVARRENKTRVLSTFGAPAERRWIADEIVRRFGRPRSTSDLPASFESVREADGAVLIRRTAGARRGAFGCGVFALLAWNVPLALWLSYASRHGIPLGGGTIVSTIVGVLFAALGVWCIASRQTWVLRHDYLAERLQFAGLGKKWEFRTAMLEMEMNTDSDGDDRFSLLVHDRTTGRKRRLFSSMYDETETLLFGRFVEKHTGWRLVLPREIVSSLQDERSAISGRAV